MKNFWFQKYQTAFIFNLYIVSICPVSNALDLLPTTVFPNFPPGGHIEDENNQKAIEALKNAKEYTIVNEEDAIQQESILSEQPQYFFVHHLLFIIDKCCK